MFFSFSHITDRHSADEGFRYLHFILASRIVFSAHGADKRRLELTALNESDSGGGDGEADERRRYRCSNLAEALETACLLDPAPPKKSAARACPARLQLIQEVIPLWAADRDRLLWLFYFLTSAINFNGQASALCSWRFFYSLETT